MNGWAAGTDQNIIHTSNGGATWTTQFGGLNTGPYNSYPLNGIRFADTSHGIAVGNSGNVFTTLNGGQTWTSQESGSPTETFGLSATDADHAWAAQANGELLLTTDGGQHWTRQTLFEGAGGLNLTAVSFADNMNGWVAALDALPAFIYHSTDGGNTWQPQNPGDTGGLQGIWAIDSQTVVAVGAGTGPVIVRSSDGGNTWQSGTFPSLATEFNGVQFVDATTGWVVGNFNVILKSTDGGQTWKAQTNGIPNFQNNLFGVSFADANNGWAVGAIGELFHTANGGQTWTSQNAHVPMSGGMPDSLYAVHAVSADVAWIAGFGFVARTTDGGQTWTSENFFPSATAFPAIWFVDADNGWAGGSGGIYNRMTGPAGLESISFAVEGVGTSSVHSGVNPVGTVTLSSAAPTGGATVTLSSSNPAVAAVPGSVTVSANQSTVAFTVTTMQVTAPEAVTITAVLGTSTIEAVLTVTPAALADLVLRPSTVTAGQSAVGQVELSGTAPAAGAVIQLASSNTSVATVPAMVTVSPGKSAANFAIHTPTGAAQGVSVIQASWRGARFEASLTVNPAPSR
jgi:photosystem II stability/assembly factor-like uncharacterized protein